MTKSYTSKRGKFNWLVFGAIAVAIVLHFLELVDLGFRFSLAKNGIPVSSSSRYLFLLHLLVLSGLILFLVFRKKWSFGVLAFLLLFKLFFPVNIHSDITYAYTVGSVFVEFLRDVLLVTIPLFTKKDGITGWNSLLGKGQSDNIAGPGEDNVQKTVTTKSRKVVGAIFYIVAPLVALLLILLVITMSKEYPDYVSSFKDKVSVVLRVPNNAMARKSLDMAFSASSKGLSNREEEYMEWCTRFNPDDADLMSEIALYYTLNNDNSSAVYWYEKAYRKKPDDDMLKCNLASAYFYSKNNIEKAVMMAESLIEEGAQYNTAYYILRDYYLESEDSAAALYWTVRAYAFSPTMTERDEEKVVDALRDMPEFNDILDRESAYIVVYPTRHEVIYCETDDEFLKKIEGRWADSAEVIRIKDIQEMPTNNKHLYYAEVREDDVYTILHLENVMKLYPRLKALNVIVKEIIPSTYLLFLSRIQ